MFNSRRIIQYTLLVCLVMLVFAAPASAADVLVTIRDRAASLLRGLKPVIFILAGFGLIGFAWMAIFNQISWKWFSNIAIGLFLVANMGLFLDYFTTKTGDGKKYTQMLGSGDYKDNMGDGYQETPGADGDPSTQVPGSNDGPAGPSGSDELDSAFAELKDEKTCSDAGGAWSNGKCSGSSSQSGTDTEGFADGAAFEQELAQNKDKTSCSENGGVWDKDKCVASWAAGENGTSFTERLECAESGGNWDGKKCVKNSSTTPPAGSGGGSDIINPPANGVSSGNCTGGKNWDPVAKQCVSGTPAYSEAKSDSADGSKCGVNQVYIQKNNACENIRADSYQSKMAECKERQGTFKDGNCIIDPEVTNKLNQEIRACNTSGGTWNAASSTCSKSNDTPQTPPNSNSGSDVINPPAGGEDLEARKACLKKLGNKWNPKTNECSAMTKEELDQAKENNVASAKSNCESKGGTWSATGVCTDKAMADKLKAQCASQGMGWNGGEKCTPKSADDLKADAKKAKSSYDCSKIKDGSWDAMSQECYVITADDKAAQQAKLEAEKKARDEAERQAYLNEQAQAAAKAKAKAEAEAKAKAEAEAEEIKKCKSKSGYDWIDGECQLADANAREKRNEECSRIFQDCQNRRLEKYAECQKLPTLEASQACENRVRSSLATETPCSKLQDDCLNK